MSRTVLVFLWYFRIGNCMCRMGYNCCVRTRRINNEVQTWWEYKFKEIEDCVPFITLLMQSWLEPNKKFVEVGKT